MLLLMQRLSDYFLFIYWICLLYILLAVVYTPKYINEWRNSLTLWGVRLTNKIVRLKKLQHCIQIFINRTIWRDRTISTDYRTILWEDYVCLNFARMSIWETTKILMEYLNGPVKVRISMPRFFQDFDWILLIDCSFYFSFRSVGTENQCMS